MLGAVAAVEREPGQIHARLFPAAKHAGVAVAAQADHAARRGHQQLCRVKESEDADADVEAPGWERVTSVVRSVRL